MTTLPLFRCTSGSEPGRSSGKIVTAGVAAVLLLSACQKQPAAPVANFLYATPNAVTMAAGSDTTVALSGGVPPYAIVQSPKSVVATASVYGATLLIHGVGPMLTSVVVGDNDAPQNKASVSITVLAHHSTP